MHETQPSYIYVKESAHLVKISSGLNKEKQIGVDLEADSMFHYQEKVCLIQISTESYNYVVDPLSIADLTSLAPVFSNQNIQKIFHGADYDIRSLYRDFGFEVNNMFDTQIAARFLGLRQTGLASLVKDRFGIIINKKYQKKDWSMRPLPPSMLAYAVHDTFHLLHLSRILTKELKDKSRLPWVKEECDLLSNVRPLSPNNDPLFVGFKDARKLDNRDLAILESILLLREKRAIRKDRPPFKIMSKDAVSEIVEKKPVSDEQLVKINNLSAGQKRSLGPSIIRNVAKSLLLPENKLPEYPTNTGRRGVNRITNGVQELKSWRKEKAANMEIEPSILLTNAQIEDLVRAFPMNRRDLKKIDTLRDWQVKQFGKEICDIFNQELC